MRRETQEVQVQVRQAPKYLTFGVFGAVIGLVTAAVLSLIAMAQPSDSSAESADVIRQISPTQAFLLLGLGLAVAGAVVMLAVALILDRRMARRARTARAVHERVQPEPADSDVAAAGQEAVEQSTGLSDGGGPTGVLGATIDPVAPDGEAGAPSQHSDDKE